MRNCKNKIIKRKDKRQRVLQEKEKGEQVRAKQIKSSARNWEMLTNRDTDRRVDHE